LTRGIEVSLESTVFEETQYSAFVRLEWLPVVGVSLYLANLILGAGLQWRWWHLHRARWVHHALYFLVFVSASTATYALFRLERRWWALLPTLLCLFLLPRARGGSRRNSA
jgi:hypothetical protein